MAIVIGAVVGGLVLIGVVIVLLRRQLAKADENKTVMRITEKINGIVECEVSARYYNMV